jgi:hypothetical protein
VVNLPPVPAELAATHPLAAALVQAGAPVAPPDSPVGRSPCVRARRRRRAAPAATTPAGAPATGDRLLGQLGERARAAERTGRRLAQARQTYDRAATDATEAALGEAALAHERALAACRALARRLGYALATPDAAAAPTGRGRVR